MQISVRSNQQAYYTDITIVMLNCYRTPLQIPDHFQQKSVFYYLERYEFPRLWITEL
ncbi:hypothetical protein HanRHA438_Chr08g0346181 [Helianthus annuus]|nr:hypothetical protein HanRHA438_Chr08g0346181 [Helianthus annuus]